MWLAVTLVASIDPQSRYSTLTQHVRARVGQKVSDSFETTS